ncbi:S8 family serine peptidase [Hydrogenophaga taeniospiralis]|uniref:S8 family peptidase n=1 Tax=Hydrogenophaga taeniospiralis TaxID=65656 RepID=UPI001CFAD810|nr:S8 family serine peptidase [Hydrogenophaga taeniospiralis]MCB4366224.1 S8 family serine peptidase [Hydrogenophaga taeniospiralis]
MFNLLVGRKRVLGTQSAARKRVSPLVWVRRLFPVTVLVAGAALAQSGPVSRSAADHQRHSALVQTASARGSVPVIVELAPQRAAGESLRVQQGTPAQVADLRVAQDRVLSRLVAARSNAGLRSAQDVARFKRFSYFPGMSLRASAQDVQALLADPEVLRVHEDVLRKPVMLDATARVGMVSGAFQGRTGAGQVVAVLDSGIEKTHPYMSGRVVSEACYSTTDAGDASTSLCPGGASSSTAVNSGLDCSSSINGCGHGTMVGGIVAGNTHPSYGGGMARSAELISIQIYSRIDDSTMCGGAPPCILTWLSDEIQGLERVYALRSSYRIAAVNMSLGGGAYSSHCDSEPEFPIVASLRLAGIATVVASGNEYQSSRLSAPACLSNVISVGSTTDGDTVSAFSNSASMLQLLAPGDDITSTYLSGSYLTGDGTSFATPMVAGAIAALKEQHPQASVDTLLAMLKNTGLGVVDSRNQLLRSRIRVDQAMSGLDSLTRISNGGSHAGQSGTTGQFSYYTVVVPSGASNLSIQTTGGTGNPNMYVKRGSRPTQASFDCSSANAGTTEACSFASPTAGTYHVMLHAPSTYSGVTVSADFDVGCASSSNIVLPSSVGGAAEHSTCGTILSNATSTAVSSTGVLQLNAGTGIQLRTGFRLSAGGRLWARVYPDMQ